MSTTRHAVIGGTTLVLLTLLTYSPIWTATFVYEDQSSIIDTTIWGRAPIAPTHARALTRASYRLDAWVGKNQPWAFHADNLILHLANGALVGVLTATLVTPSAGWIAATIFLLHPLNTEAVAYGAGRTEVLSALFALLTLLLLMRGRWGIWLAPVTFALALSAKESSVALVPLIGWYGLLYWPRFSTWLTSIRLWSRVLVPIVAAGAAIAWMARTIITREFMVTSDLPLWHYFLVQAAAFWRYVALVIVPIGQSAEHNTDQLPFGVTVLAGGALIAAMCLVALAYLATDVFQTWRSRKANAVLFGLGWIAFALLPRFVMRIPEVLNEHQCYLWMVGWAILLAALCTSAKEIPDGAVA